MVLSDPRGGAGAAGTSPPQAPSAVRPAAPATDARASTALRGSEMERGSQALEVALALPFAVILCLLVVHAGIAAMDLVAAQTLAREAARMAAVDDDSAVRVHLDEAAGRRPVDLDLRPPSPRRARGDTVTARLRLRSRAFAAFGVDVWMPAQATMRVEDP